MTDIERLKFSVDVELDLYINLAREGVKDKNVRMFLTNIIIPRMMTLKAAIGNYEESKFTFEKRRELEIEFMKTQDIAP